MEQFFDLVAQPDLNDNAYEWWARAALLAEKWELVSQLISKMTPPTRDSARWRYWAARAAGAQHDMDATAICMEVDVAQNM